MTNISSDIPLEGLPIEFKKINPEDFDNNLYKTEQKIIVSPNKEGYISDSLLPILKKDSKNKNTTIINAGVGQGKTTALINMITDYIKEKDIIIVIAVPYKSLIKQYKIDCKKHGIPENIILNQLDLDRLLERNIISKSKNTTIRNWGFTSDNNLINEFKISNYKVHIITVNSLLGNSGDSLFQSKSKNIYFNKLTTYCEKQNKRLVIIYDEIHDAIRNFEERYIYSFWKYQNLIHKNYIISATFNEASKEIIKHLSEFTERKIKIIESKRVITQTKQSRLHLHFYSDEQIIKNKSLNRIINSCYQKKQKFDILCYSKALAEKLVTTLTIKDYKNTNICHIPKEKINKCFTNTFRPEETKRYNKELINIGTNFSTGINIEEENHAYIILLPKNLNIQYLNNNGIFTSGSNTIIQALARQRKKGDIYIFSEKPKNIDPESLPDYYKEEQKNTIINYFNKYQNFKGEIKYSDINLEHEELQRVYDKIKSNLQGATTNIKNSNRAPQLNRLEYPPQEIFNLNLGKKHLTNIFFGGDLSSFILWSALTNQFLNCKLHNIEIDETIYFSSENFDKDLEKKVKEELYYFEYDFIDYEEIGRIIKTTYEKIQFLKELFYKKRIINDEKILNEYDKREVFLKAIYILFFKNIWVSDESIKEKVYHYYIFNCVCSAINIDFDSESIKYCTKHEAITKTDIKIINCFKDWYKLIRVICENIIKQGRNLILSESAIDKFNEEYQKLNFSESLNYLLKNDLLLSTNIFQLKNSTSNKKDIELQKYILNLTLKVFFKVKRKKINVNGNRRNEFVFNSKKPPLMETKGYLLKTLPEIIFKF